MVIRRGFPAGFSPAQGDPPHLSAPLIPAPHTSAGTTAYSGSGVSRHAGRGACGDQLQGHHLPSGQESLCWHRCRWRPGLSPERVVRKALSSPSPRSLGPGSVMADHAAFSAPGSSFSGIPRTDLPEGQQRVLQMGLPDWPFVLEYATQISSALLARWMAVDESAQVDASFRCCT